MSKKVKFVVLGYGFIGKKHVELILNHNDAELVAIIDTDAEKLKGINSTSCFNSLQLFLKSNLDCDFVNICTPNYLHIVHSIEALAGGMHVICEKPLGLSLKECLNLKEIERETGKKMICVLQNRYSPPIQWLKQVIEEQHLGKIFHIQINCYWNRDDRYYYPNGKKHTWKGTKEKDGGVLFTQFSHFVDILTWCFGEVRDVLHVSQNYIHKDKTDFDDTGSIIFKVQENGLANFNYSTSVWDKNLESSMLVIGEKGSLKIGGQYMDEVVHCHIENYSMPRLAASMPANDYGHYKGSAQNHCYVIQNAIDFILNNAKIDVGLDEGIMSVRNILKLNETLGENEV